MCDGVAKTMVTRNAMIILLVQSETPVIKKSDVTGCGETEMNQLHTWSKGCSAAALGFHAKGFFSTARKICNSTSHEKRRIFRFSTLVQTPAPETPTCPRQTSAGRLLEHPSPLPPAYPLLKSRLQLLRSTGSTKKQIATFRNNKWYQHILKTTTQKTPPTTHEKSQRLPYALLARRAPTAQRNRPTNYRMHVTSTSTSVLARLIIILNLVEQQGLLRAPSPPDATASGIIHVPAVSVQQPVALPRLAVRPRVRGRGAHQAVERQVPPGWHAQAVGLSGRCKHNKNKTVGGGGASVMRGRNNTPSRGAVGEGVYPY